MTPAKEAQESSDLLARLGALAAQRSQVEADIRTVTQNLTELGVSWRAIGSALGTSGQAAWDRYRLTRNAHGETQPDRDLTPQLPMDESSQAWRASMATGAHRPGFGRHLTVDEYESCPWCTPTQTTTEAPA